jgi:hypothetical protein
MSFYQKSFVIKDTRFWVKRVPKTSQLWYWKSSKAMSGRAFPTIAAARKAAENYLGKFGDRPVCG